MNATLKKILSIALVLCLALTGSALAFADGGNEPAPARYIPCPSCATGKILERTEYGFIWTYITKHFRHLDYEHWNVDILVTYCDTCSYRTDTVLRRNYLVVIDCPGLPR